MFLCFLMFSFCSMCVLMCGNSILLVLLGSGSLRLVNVRLWYWVGM